MQTEKSIRTQQDVVEKILSTIPVETTGKTIFDTDFVERLLGRKQGGTLSRSTSVRLKRITREILSCIEPKLTYEIYTIKEIAEGRITLSGGMQFESRKMAKTLEGASLLVCFVSTIGPKIDLHINNLMHHRGMADAYVADTIGSGAIEHVAERFHSAFAEKIMGIGGSVSLRFSPGYCDWNVSEQQKLFSMLDNESVEVDLGSTFLMTPRKSISATFGIFDGNNHETKNSDRNPCRSCWKKDCIARRADPVTPSH